MKLSVSVSVSEPWLQPMSRAWVRAERLKAPSKKKVKIRGLRTTEFSAAGSDLWGQRAKF